MKTKSLVDFVFWFCFSEINPHIEHSQSYDNQQNNLLNGDEGIEKNPQQPGELFFFKEKGYNGDTLKEIDYQQY